MQYPDYLGGERRSGTIIGEISASARHLVQEEQDASAVVMRRLTGAAVDASFVLPGSGQYLEWAEGILQQWAEDFAKIMASYASRFQPFLRRNLVARGILNGSANSLESVLCWLALAVAKCSV